MCPAPVDTPISGPEGNINSSVFTDYGCPVYSSGETYLSEMMFVNAKVEILDWIQHVALAGDTYTNPKIYVDYADKQHYDGDEDWAKGEVEDGVMTEVINVDESAKGREDGGGGNGNGHNDDELKE